MNQVGFLVIFGTFQMGIPYLLMTRGLQSVSPQEAGTLTLVEPLLNPVWAYLVAQAKEKPTIYIFLGGGLILLGLAYRYWPGTGTTPAPAEPTPALPPSVSKGPADGNHFSQHCSASWRANDDDALRDLPGVALIGSAKP